MSEENGTPAPKFVKIIRVPVKPYTGTVPSKIRRYNSDLELAKRIEEYITTLRDKGYRQADYGGIAIELGVTKKRVRDLLFPIDADSNGIQIYKLEVQVPLEPPSNPDTSAA